MENLKRVADTLAKVYSLASPFGRRRLAFVMFFSGMQGLFQVLGVTSIFPFLAMVSDPSGFRDRLEPLKAIVDLSVLTDARLLVISGLFAILLILVSNVINIVSEFIGVRYVSQYAHWLRLSLLRKILTRPYDDFLNIHSGVLMKKVYGDVALFTSSVFLPVIGVMVRIVTIVLLILTLFIVDPKIAFFSVVTFGGIYLTIFKLFAGWRQSTSEGLKLANQRASMELLQLLGGVKAVKIYRSEEYFIERFRGYSSEQARLNAWIPIVSNSPRYLIEPVLFVGIVGVVLYYNMTGTELLKLLPSLGVLALAGYRLLPAIQLTYGMVTQIVTSHHALEEVYEEYLAVEKDSAASQEVGKGFFSQPSRIPWKRELRLEKVSFSYPGARTPVLHNIDISIPRNASLGISGTTGSGKSTLVDLILGLHIPTSGRIFADDQEIVAQNRRAWRAGIGYVPQEIYLIDDTVTANIAFGVHESEVDMKRVEEAAAAAQIKDFISHELPEGFSTKVGEHGVRLSGGQRQRIGLARALYIKPDLLVLDEATSALDVETEAEIMQAIRALQGEVTMIIIAHRLSTIEHCDMRIDLVQVKSESQAQAG